MAFRDHLANRRSYTSDNLEGANLPRFIGINLSNRFDETFERGGRRSPGRWQYIDQIPSNKDNKADFEAFGFSNKLRSIAFLDSSTKTWMKDWHNLCSSFAHVDPYALSMDQVMRNSKRDYQTQRDILADMCKLHTKLFMSSTIQMCVVYGMKGYISLLEKLQTKLQHSLKPTYR
ncbi:MAG: hypothetical protein AAGK92_09705 [Pseudomonadota bacterium]